MALTVLSIKNAQPQAKAYKLSDERSLFLRVMSNGAKYLRFCYRFPGKQKTLAPGVWPEVGLAEVREKRRSAEAGCGGPGSPPGKEAQENSGAVRREHNVQSRRRGMAHEDYSAYDAESEALTERYGMLDATMQHERFCRSRFARNGQGTLSTT